ncbi:MULTISPECIES: shikimate kinase [Halolamina]|uniref:Shikimate kinase n=1 Tax=Halolamina pelagica TaxID=699431 RepID=A0A1I5M1M5_9EURY|nr:MULTISPECIES: shikimate kinase [Halolamina]NHX35823.1 shikimate kinase [Halolamina sp. R1-12]SFP03504.1 shikimate kinase [Halolamina pelagica]
MDGHAAAPGAGTVLNALATGRGSAFALDFETDAHVELDGSGEIVGEIGGQPDADTELIEHCVSRTVERWGDDPAAAELPDPDAVGGTVRTESEVPTAAGLKSSSAAANATVLATVDALGLAGIVDHEDACRVGVQAAREAGVTVTGAFDDASASMLGGLTVTDNTEDELLVREEVDWDALVWTPPERAYSADADAERCELVAPMARLVAELALDGAYGRAMTVNGLAFSAALGFSTDPAVEAMPHAAGVSLSGTGPSVVAVGDRDGLERVEERWAERPGETLRTATRPTGGRYL